MPRRITVLVLLGLCVVMFGFRREKAAEWELVGDIPIDEARALLQRHRARTLALQKSMLARAVKARDLRLAWSSLVCWTAEEPALIYTQSDRIVYVKRRFSRRTPFGFGIGASYERVGNDWVPISQVESVPQPGAIGRVLRR